MLTYLTTCALPETRTATARNRGLSLSRDTRNVPSLLTSHLILISSNTPRTEDL